MTTAQLTDVDSPEATQILRWRLRTLVAAGYLYGDAVALAMARDVDLHDATRLLQRGCPSRLAVQILL
ncbi:MAG: hypothetical protein ACRDNB_12910 [Gaiellaceae bacterium]